MLKKMLEYFWNLTTSSQPKLRKKKEDIEVGYIFTIEGKPFKTHSNEVWQYFTAIRKIQ